MISLLMIIRRFFSGRGRPVWIASWVGVLVGLAAPASAQADPTELFGLDARTMGMANAGAALGGSWASATHNPAAAALAPRIELGVGYGYGHAWMTVNHHDGGLMDMRGIAFGLVAPFALPKGLRLSFAMTAYIPDQFLARVQLIPAYEPRFVRLDNSPNRISVTPVVALKVWRLLSLGIGAAVLADAAGTGVRFDVGVKGGTKVGEAAVDVDLPTKVTPIAGVFFGPIGGFSVGIVYRGELDLRLALDILANVDVSGVVTGDTVIDMRAVNYFTPQKLTAGLAYNWRDCIIAAATLTWRDWSAFRSGTADVRLFMDLGLSPPMLQTEMPADNFQDTLSVRVGCEYRHPLDHGRGLAFRVGYGFEPSPVPAQIGLSALLDNDRHIVTAGFGVNLGRISQIVPWVVGIDVAVQYHHMINRVDERALRWGGLGGGGLLYGGDMLHVALSGTVGF